MACCVFLLRCYSLPLRHGVLFTQTSVLPIAWPASCIRNYANKQYSNEAFKTENVIYEGPLNRQIYRVKLFSLASSVTGLISQPLIYNRACELNTSTSTMIALCSIVGFFTFLTPLLLHWLTKKYVITVVHNNDDDSYTAVTYSLFLQKKKITLKPGEGSLPDVPGTFSNLEVRGTPLFIDARFFTDVLHYKRIMGFDQPINFHLKSDPSLTEKE